MSKPMRVEFHMRNGSIVTAYNVDKIKMTRDTATGSYGGYHIEWVDGFAPCLFTLSIPDIVAVIAIEWETAA